MGIFRQFPYSNFHDMNMDPIIKIMREMQDDWEATKTEWASYKEYIDNYFKNLDVSDEVLRAMRMFAEDGTLNDIMDPTIAKETAAWLAEHITTPETVVIDSSLTVEGAAADAKATGAAITKTNYRIGEIGQSRFRREFNIIDYMDKTDETRAGVTYTWSEKGCHIEGTSTATSFNRIYYKLNEMPDFIPQGTPIMAQIESDNPDSLVRFDILKCINGELAGNWMGITPSYDGDGVFYGVIPSDTEGLLIRIYVKNQLTVNENVRVSIIPQISEYNIANSKNAIVSDFNEHIENGIYFVSTGINPEPQNLPYQAPGWLEVANIGVKDNVAALQIYYPFNPEAHDIMFRTKMRDVWTNWKALGSGGGGGGTVIENTYNITTSPAFTTDNNGWLQPVDTESESDAGKTDMTGAIMSMLNDTGYCHLAPGIFYVSGNIDMPEGSELVGCGRDTIVRLLSSTSTGYIVRASQYNTVRDIRFSGGYSDPGITVGTVGTRHGIAFIGNDDGADTSIPAAQPSSINNCWFENFIGSGIYCHNAGNSPYQALMVSDCVIRNCRAGINIDYRSEYMKFVNNVITRCYYACINNGGNNIFINCTFHGTIGMQLHAGYNTGHGSAVGCIFNHSDNWNDASRLGNGIGIQINGVNNGFVFTGCQIWYSQIEVRNSRGVSFNDCQFGGGTPKITITGSYGAFFNGCIFHATPDITKNAGTRFNNCYLDSTSTIIS